MNIHSPPPPPPPNYRVYRNGPAETKLYLNWETDGQILNGENSRSLKQFYCTCALLTIYQVWPKYHVATKWYLLTFLSRKNAHSIRTMATKNFIASFERTFKIISKILLYMFHILLDSWNILTESNELSAILDYWGYAWYVTSGVTQVFYPDS
jgi:hypothetical protein